VLGPFPAAYLDRLAAPVGRGDLLPADLAGEVGSVVGGSGVRVTLRLAAGGARVAEARFRAFGSVAPFGPGSVLVEGLRGLDLASARALAAKDLLAPFGPHVPSAVARAAAHLVEALHKALDGGAGARTAARADAEGVLVCRCLAVGDRTIRNAIREGANDVPAIGLATSAGHGCHSCWPDLRTLLDEEAEIVPNGSPEAPGDPLSRAVEAIVRPVWRAQGLVLGSVRVVGDVVTVSVAGREPDALASDLGGVAIARHHLREALGDAVRVELAPPPPGSEAGSAHVGRAATR
jgi:bacterioferritin-associated ferredoxin